jgi:hypothetical protein
LGIVSWFKRKPPKSREKSMTSTPRRLATPWFLTTIPRNRQIIAAARLKSTRKSMNLPNSGAVGTRPVIGYTMQPMMTGGKMRSGTISKTTLAM